MPKTPTTLPELVDYLTDYTNKAPADWRYGQALFNGLYEIEPELANLVRGTIADPFHAYKSTDERVQRFWGLVSTYYA